MPDSYDSKLTFTRAIEMDPEELADYVFVYVKDAARGNNFAPLNYIDGMIRNEIAGGPGNEAILTEKLEPAFSTLQANGLVYPLLKISGNFKIMPNARLLQHPSEVREFRRQRSGDPKAAYDRSIADLNDKCVELETAVQKAADDAIKSAVAQRDAVDAYAANVEKKLRETSLKVSVKAAQDEFEIAQVSNKKKAIGWGVASLIVVAVFFSLIVLFLFHPLETVASQAIRPAQALPGQPALPPPSDKEILFRLIYNAILKATLLTALGATATFCLRVVRAQLHMNELNLHRKRLANSTSAFVESAYSPEQRDLILGRLVDAVAAFGNSGLLGEREDTIAPTKLAIDSITRQVKD